MKVETYVVTKLTITDAPRLDPISVYLEDFGPGRGKCTITCYDDSWTYFWGAMGESYDIKKFLTKCDIHYLSNKFRNGAPTREPDPDKLKAVACKHITERRWQNIITKDVAREQYDKAAELEDLWHEMSGNSESFMDAMYEIFGDEWYERMPEKPHHQYEYLQRIVATVQEAIKALSPSGEGEGGEGE